MKSFGQWLAEIELDRYAEIFSENRIDFDVIATLTEADLRELGVALGDRKRLMQAIADLTGVLRPNHRNFPDGVFTPQKQKSQLT